MTKVIKILNKLSAGLKRVCRENEYLKCEYNNKINIRGSRTPLELFSANTKTWVVFTIFY